MVVAQPIVSLALSLLFYLVPAAGASVASFVADLNEHAVMSSWEASVAERMGEMPNPYQDSPSELPGSLREVQASGIAPFSESPSERHWFDMEDSGDMMGLPLNDFLRAGLQVEFSGPAEEPKQSRRQLDSKWDPYHPAYLPPPPAAGAVLDPNPGLRIPGRNEPSVCPTVDANQRPDSDSHSQVVDENGVIWGDATPWALTVARQRGLDLVEVAAEARPPVCKYTTSASTITGEEDSPP
jgi:hypothetical protein